MTKIKFTLRIERFFGSYRVVIEEYDLSKVTINEKIEETNKLVSREVLGNYHRIEGAIELYMQRKDGVSRNLFSVNTISCNGVYSTDFISNDLSDVNMFLNNSRRE